MPARDRRILLASAVATSALLLLAAVAGHAEVLAYAAPLFLVAVPLLAGRYVGEERLEALRGHVAPRRRRATAAQPRAPRPGALLPRGGRLIAESLAVRPPPGPALS